MESFMMNINYMTRKELKLYRKAILKSRYIDGDGRILRIGIR
jgi:hypothetical protein